MSFKCLWIVIWPSQYSLHILDVKAYTLFDIKFLLNLEIYYMRYIRSIKQTTAAVASSFFIPTLCSSKNIHSCFLFGIRFEPFVILCKILNPRKFLYA